MRLICCQSLTVVEIALCRGTSPECPDIITPAFAQFSFVVRVEAGGIRTSAMAWWQSRNKKTTRERREQRLRAEGRTASRLLRAFQEVQGHRGGQLSKFGMAMLAALAGMQDTVEQIVPEHIVAHTVDVPVPQDVEGIDTEHVAPAPTVARRRRTGKCTASSPAVARATPDPMIEYVAPVIEFKSPAATPVIDSEDPVIDYASPATACAAHTPVIDSVAPVIEYASPAAAYAAPTPVIEHVVPTASYAAPSPVIDSVAPVSEYVSLTAAYAAPAPVIDSVASAIENVSLAAAHAAHAPMIVSVAPVIESMSSCAARVPETEYVSSSPAAACASPTPVVDSVASAPAVTSKSEFEALRADTEAELLELVTAYAKPEAEKADLAAQSLVVEEE